jgi:hypothetical protein
MYIPKRYGQSKAILCPFCKKDAITKNRQQVPVCSTHKNSLLKEFTCFCGETLELKDGKFGIYFSCINCGNINLKKALEMNPDLGYEPEVKDKTSSNETKTKVRKEITITSDEVDVNYS